MCITHPPSSIRELFQEITWPNVNKTPDKFSERWTSFVKNSSWNSTFKMKGPNFFLTLALVVAYLYFGTLVVGNETGTGKLNS